jgi:predicted  nucleic acid-binding Zn-ribbon protein
VGDSEAAAKVQLKKITELRAEMKDIAEGAKEKDANIKQLQANLESIQDQMGRTSYVKTRNSTQHYHFFTPIHFCCIQTELFFDFI